MTLAAITSACCSQRGGEAVAHLGRHLVAHVQELAEMRIVGRARRVVTQRRGKGSPSQPATVSGDGSAARSMSTTEAYGAHSSSNRRQAPRYTSLAISSPSPPAAARPISSSSQVVPAVFRCTPASNFFKRLVHRPVDGELVAAGMHAQLQVLRQVGTP